MGNATSNSDDAIDADEIVHPAVQRIGARKPDSICCLTCQDFGNPLDQHHFESQDDPPRKQDGGSPSPHRSPIKQTRFHPSLITPGADADSIASGTPVSSHRASPVRQPAQFTRTPLSPAVFYQGPTAPGWTAAQQEQLQWSVEIAAEACGAPPPSYSAMQAPRRTRPFCFEPAPSCRFRLRDLSGAVSLV
jgi:hypothetical protein